MLHFNWVANFCMCGIIFHNVTVFEVRSFVCIHDKDDFCSKVSLGIDEELQVDDCIVRN